ncbi:hypothetical protein EUGRSUZ_A02995, partial [Eucalyptus grandis]
KGERGGGRGEVLPFALDEHCSAIQNRARRFARCRGRGRGRSRSGHGQCDGEALRALSLAPIASPIPQALSQPLQWVVVSPPRISRTHQRPKQREVGFRSRWRRSHAQVQHPSRARERRRFHRLPSDAVHAEQDQGASQCGIGCRERCLWGWSACEKHAGSIKPRLLETNDMTIWAFRTSIDVVASSFEGQSTVNRQRMVYKAIWEELQSTVHAVDQMTTRTPAEAASD